MSSDKPVVLITGSAGALGSAISENLADRYKVVGCDRPGTPCDIEMDIASSSAVIKAIAQIKEKFGDKIAAVIHLAAYFDFSGEDSPLYEKVNVTGTRNLLDGLQELSVERFIYSSTMLVHKAGRPGQKVHEDTPIQPGWAYPISKARTEDVIQKHHGGIPFVILRLAGLYDQSSAVPTLAHQIARIYERNPKSKLYAGDLQAGQALLHREDMITLFRVTIDRRRQLPRQIAILAGEPEAVSYQTLQEEIGRRVHGVEEWRTLSLPKTAAKAGAWLEEKLETVVPDEFDSGRAPFIKPFMVDMASDHYDLDVSRADRLLGWSPRHRIIDELPQMLEVLLNDPARWYEKNHIPKPDWMVSASEKHQNAERLRTDYERKYQAQHWQGLWARFLIVALGGWLLFAPLSLGYESRVLVVSNVITGIWVIIFGLISLSPKPWLREARWLVGLGGLWLLFAPLIFWAPTAAAYLNDTVTGALLIGFALLVRPFPSASPAAELTGPNVPPGWDLSPSDWFQRIPIIALAFVGFVLSRYMAAYQLGHIDGVWDPFFGGALADGRNGTEEIITSDISEAWPVPDAGLGSLVYLLEILAGIAGSRRRWRTMPWLVLFFCFLIIPLGVISIAFIIIQPIVLSTWCALCLMTAILMLLQIPYASNEVVATIDFLKRRAAMGRPWLRILFTGDTDEPVLRVRHRDQGNFYQPVRRVVQQMLGGGVSYPWPIVASFAIGVWLMFTRVTLGTEGAMANADHVIGALVATVSVCALAEVLRPLHYLNRLLGIVLLITPWLFNVGLGALVASSIAGVALIGLTLPRTNIQHQYGRWGRWVNSHL